MNQDYNVKWDYQTLRKVWKCVFTAKTGKERFSLPGEMADIKFRDVP